MIMMERVLSIQNRLQKLLGDAEKEAEAMVSKAQSAADEKLTAARDEAARKRAMAQRGSGIEELLKEEEEKAEKEAKKILKDYEAKAEALKVVPEEKMKEAVDFMLEEVLPQ